MDLIAYALDLHHCGLAIAPKQETKKVPTVKEWQKFADEQTDQQVIELFSVPSHGICLILRDCQEVIDIDNKYSLDGNLNDRYMQLVKMYHPTLLDKLIIQLTPSGGLHLVYQVEKGNYSNQKLASRPATLAELKEKPDTKQYVLLETRGKGGQIIIDPSEGYQIIQGRFQEMPVITRAERDILIDTARSFHVRTKSTIGPSDARHFVNGTNKTSWDDYDERCTVDEMVEHLVYEGWTELRRTSENIYLTRPGKTKKMNEISGDISIHKKVFKCWSTSTDWSTDERYGPFGVFAKVHHNLRYKEAAIDLLKKGYGEQYSKEQLIDEEIDPEDAMFNKLLDESFDLSKPIPNEKAVLFVKGEKRSYKLGFAGSVIAIVGRPGSRKTSNALGIKASALLGGNVDVLSYKFYLPETHVILDFDTEQPKVRWQKTNKKLYTMMGKTKNDPRLKSFSLRQIPKSNRLSMILRIMDKYAGRIGAVFIDKIPDLCLDYNDHVEANEILSTLMQYVDRESAIMFPFIHEAKTSKEAKGSLGQAILEIADGVIVAKLDYQDRSRSIISCNKSREYPFEDFAITMDADGIPIMPNQTEFHGGAAVAMDIEDQESEEDDDLPF